MDLYCAKRLMFPKKREISKYTVKQTAKSIFILVMLIVVFKIVKLLMKKNWNIYKKINLIIKQYYVIV